MRKVKALSARSFYSYKTRSLVKHLNKIVGKNLYFTIGELAYLVDGYACVPIERTAVMGKLLGVYGVIDKEEFLDWNDDEYTTAIKESLLAR